MDYEYFDNLCDKLTDCYYKLDEEAFYMTDDPATEDEICAAEERMGVKLPKSLREFFLRYSKEFRISAFMPDEFCETLPNSLRGLFASKFTIGLRVVEYSENNRKTWIENCFDNEEDEYDKVWYHKLALTDVGNGDIIALDIEKDPEDPPVVYLSHDDSEGHGVVLGKNFESFLMDLIKVGGCGMEDWQMIPFIPEGSVGIDPDCENAKAFRKLIGFEL